MKFKRIFLMVLESIGVGETSDAIDYGDLGANTLKHVVEKSDLYIPNLAKIGFLDTINMSENDNVDAYYTVAKPINVGKDTLSGHYEILGIKNEVPFQTFNKGFTYEILSSIEQITGRTVIGNQCCYDDSIIQKLGERQYNYGSLIIYTGADSDLNVAVHEDCISIAQLYNYCERIKDIIIQNKWSISRVIARPFKGTPNKYKFIESAKKDYPTITPKTSILNSLNNSDYSVIGIGKINDIFQNQGINKNIKATNNNEAINKLTDIIDKDFTGLCIVNLSDFDTLYGHLRNVDGFAKAIEELDVEIPIIINKLDLDDLLIITADHGNDPTFTGNDHTRENLPVIIYSRNFKQPQRLEPFETLANIGATIADNFDIDMPEIGTSFLDELE